MTGNHATEEEHGDDLGGEGFGGGDGDFGAGVDVGATIDFAGDGGSDDIDDAEGFDTTFFDFAQTSEGVGGFAGLGNNEGDGVFGDVEGAIAVLGGDDDFSGEVGDELFEVVGGEEAGVVGGAAADNDDVVEVLHFFFGEVWTAKVHGAVFEVNATAEGVSEGLGLFHDFLEEEVGVAMFLDLLEVAGDGFGGVALRFELEVEDVSAVGSADGDFAVI